MKTLILSSLLVLSTLPITSKADDTVLEQQIDLALKDFPTTPPAIEQFQTSAIRDFNKDLAAYKALPKDKLTFETAINGWHKLIEEFFARRTALKFAFLTSSDSFVIKRADAAAEFMETKLKSACLDPNALTVCLTYIETALKSPDSLTSSQKYYLKSILETVLDGWPEDNPLRKKAAHLQDLLSKQEMLNFTYIRGGLTEKTLPADRVATVINWNVCFFNHGLSMIFGGVLPWEDRIEKVAAKIREVDADVVCLQEMFAQDAGVALQKLLANSYAHFYINIGPKPCGFDYEAIGIPSGLFVASKYPLNNAAFTPYNRQETPKVRGYGVFMGDLTSGAEPLARIATTHLHPGDGPENAAFRSVQIEAVMSHLRSTDTAPLPSFLCGDLNIERGSDEYKKMVQNFVNLYSGKDWTCCELRNYWWKAGQNVKKFEEMGLAFEWIDYFLRMRTGREVVTTETVNVLSVNDPADPKTALSDHQIMKTQISFNKK